MNALLSPNRDFMSGPKGKTPSELDAIIAGNHCKFKESRMQAMHQSRMEGNALQDVFATCINEGRFTDEDAIRRGRHPPSS